MITFAEAIQSLTPNAKCITKDNEVVEWTYNSKNGYQHMFPDVEFDWWDYVNAGFVVVNKKHRDLKVNIPRKFSLEKYRPPKLKIEKPIR